MFPGVPNARDDRLAPLTGIRFAAALGILLFHYGGALVEGAPAWARALQTGGHAWVSLFYVLSGFVLAWANPRPMDRAERRAFLAARLARLYPAYLLAFALSAPFALARWSGDGAAGLLKAAVVAVASLLLVHAWLPPISRLWNPPGWSTSAIATFYAAFPYATARLAGRSRRGLALAMAAAWAASLALPLAYLALRPDGPGAELLRHEPRWLEALKFHPVARLGEFVAGVALGLLLRRGAALPARAAGPAVALALGAVVGALAWSGFPYVLVHNGLLVPLWLLLIAGLARLAEGGGAVARGLSARPLQALGDASFALYALQDPLWRWAELLARDPGTPASPAYVLGFAAGAVAISVAVSRWVERPARRALRAALGSAPLAAARPPAP